MHVLLCMGSNYIQLNRCNELGAPIMAPSRRHESTADCHIYLVRNGTCEEQVLLFLLPPERLLPHVLTFLQGEFKYPSWHGVKARHQQLASQWPGELAMVTRKSSKIFPVGQRITIPSKLRHLYAFHCSMCCYQIAQHNPYPIQNRISNALWKRDYSWVPLATS